MIDGTTNQTNGIGSRLSNGEAGLHHLVEPLHGVSFTSEVKASAWIVSTIEALFGPEFAKPTISINSRFGKRTHGRYTYRTHHIQLSPYVELRTVAHELAHHVNWVASRGTGHGPQFKRVFAMILRHTLTEMGVPIPTTPIRERVTLPPVGIDVIVNSPRRGVYMGKVIKSMRTRCVVRAEDGMMYRVPADLMEWDR